MVLHVSISFHGHIWLLEANLFGEEKQHIFCKFRITPRSWISFMRVGMWTTTPLPMRFLQASMAPVGSSGWTLRLSWLCDDSCRGIGTGSSPVYWRFCTPLRLRWSKTKYFKHFLSYSYNISLRLRATKNGNVRQDFASNSLASGHDWSNKHQGDPLSQETMGIESEWSIKLRDGSKLKLRAVLIGDNEIGTWKRLEDYEVANIMAIIHSTRQTMAICYS